MPSDMKSIRYSTWDILSLPFLNSKCKIILCCGERRRHNSAHKVDLDLTRRRGLGDFSFKGRKKQQRNTGTENPTEENLQKLHMRERILIFWCRGLPSPSPTAVAAASVVRTSVG